jgi:hypothetical protein
MVFAFHRHEANVHVGYGALCQWAKFLIDEEQGSSAIHKQLGYLVVMECGVERDDGVSGSDDAEVSCQPSRAVGGEDGAASTAFDAVLSKPGANGVRHSAKFGIRIPFNAVM